MPLIFPLKRKLSILVTLTSITNSFLAYADPPSNLPPSLKKTTSSYFEPVRVEASDLSDDNDETLLGETLLKRKQLKNNVNDSPDVTSLFQNQLGFSQYNAGQISSLPVLNGMADDRVATSVDGMHITGSCPNHMNPAFSYLNPHDVAIAKIIAGITPVSIGGDSIAGTINVERGAPIFAKTKQKIFVSGEISSFYHSNGDGVGTSGNVTVANDHLSLRYNGSWSQANNYHAGSGGGRVHSSEYRNFNHDVTLAYKKGNHLFSLTVGQSDTPYEGFPNQYMDMTKNQSVFINGLYQGEFDWGNIEARGYWQRVTHVMNMLSDKGGRSPTTGMPMNVNNRLAGYSLKTDIFIDDKNTIKLGNSFDLSTLNDWWPPLQNSMMMGPNTYHNINHGHRNHLGTFAELKTEWTPKLTTLLGVRSDIIMMNTGEVSGYKGLKGMNPEERQAMSLFNSSNRGRTDINFDVTALATWKATNYMSIEGGYARKTRSPNLYERYSWGTTPMGMKMIGWFGDGNGYIGDIHLKPEVGNTVSTTIHFHDIKAQRWTINIQPYFTYIHHYINVNYLGQIAGKAALATVSKLQFANHNAHLYGINSNASYTLWHNKTYGKGTLQGNLNWVRGEDLTNHNSLYHIMPVNGTLSLNETLGAWIGRIEANFVNTKSLVDPLRKEQRTPGYILLNLGGSYTWKYFRFDFGIDNLMDKKYYLPLGGLSIGDLISDNIVRPVPGIGRSFNFALTASF